ncbi:glycine reductase [Crassaminicella thermophila]|uniref:Glycine reductase n=1 Tax=Crassaminicella thermophila TaxID=2599308 RepID=A0A5C0SCD8_CRATE|nr:glycine/sarcosine/betaine reductase complex component C subunit alpha [Crassaminicella thermophila]QEK11851.1 glycine reductase [Crassaminicella thermophila]
MSENKAVKQIIGKTFMEIAEAIKTGQFGNKVKVGLTILGSEHGIENLVKGAELAAKQDSNFDIVLIGPKVDTDLEIVEVQTEEEMHKKMEELLDNGYIHSCVTMHYNFPIGVSTVGRVITPGFGKEMYIATTTGTSSAHRTEAMVKNALYGIITAKAMGINEPTVGILNLDGARQVERALKELDANGYKINFAESMRSDGGAVMRGNDLLGGTADVMVTDTLTGNIMMKVFSSYTTGGSYEALGYGYGPGIGDGYERIILILSRASGVPVVANALKYAAKLSQGKLIEVAREEFEKAKNANFEEILRSITKDNKKVKEDEEVSVPPKEIVTGSISGIDIMDLEDAVKVLWKAGIYAESGMGCTGPIVLVNEEKLNEATDVLSKAGFVAKEGDIC